jgi:polysaccharide biosynthesis transport protein
MDNNLSLLVSVLKRRALPATATVLSAMAVGLAHGLLSEPAYKTSTRLVIDNQTVSVSELGQAITDVQSSIPTGANLLATQSEMIKSERVLHRALQHLTLDLGSRVDGLTVNDLRRNLTVNVIPATNILELSYSHPDPEVVAIILDRIAEAAVSEGIDSVRSEATALREFLESTIPQQENKLLLAEEAESRYRQETGIVAIDVQTENLVKSLADIKDKERDLLTQLEEAEVRGNLLQEVTGVDSLERAYRAVRVGQNEDINELEAQLLSLESDVIETQSRLGPQHPDLLALLEQRDETRELYQQELAKILPSGEMTSRESSETISQDLVSEFIMGSFERSALKETLGTIRAERVKLENNLAQIPKFQQPLASLVREREEASNTLSLLRNKLEEARIAEAQIVNNIRLIDSAEVPTSPSSSPLVSLVLSTAAGLFAAAGVIVLLEAIDDRLHDAAELEAITDLPVLGVLPKGLPRNPDISGVKDFLTQPQRTEPYRQLVKTLEFHSQSKPGTKPNIFVISGLQECEGQSLTATHLAAVASQMSRQSLVIDANWQRPLQHFFFSVRPRPGLSEALHGTSYSDLTEVQSSAVSNLDVLSFGTISENAARGNLAETPEIHTLLMSASKCYDFVVVAAPPIAVCADAATLSNYGAGLVIVVQSNVTSRSLLKRTISDLKKSGTTILGLVMAQTPDLFEGDYPFLEAPSRGYSPLASSARPRVAVDSEK